MSFWRDRAEDLSRVLTWERENGRRLLGLNDEANRRHERELAAQAENFKAEFIEETRRSNAATAERTRQETLEIVLKALDLPGYGSDIGKFSVRYGYKPEYPTDRFWADINTALEVRAERKAADERAATEAKIAKLGQQAGVTLGDSDAFAKSVARLLGSTAGPSTVSSLIDDSAENAKKGGKK